MWMLPGFSSLKWLFDCKVGHKCGVNCNLMYEVHIVCRNKLKRRRLLHVDTDTKHVDSLFLLAWRNALCPHVFVEVVLLSCGASLAHISFSVLAPAEEH